MTDRHPTRKPTPLNTAQVVYIVDDDASMREALLDLLLSVQIEAASFSTAKELLDTGDLQRAGCILLDVRLPGLNGLEFQSHLEKIGNRMPIVFMTGHGDIPMTVQAMKAGAVDFLTKPFRDQDLLDAVTSAFTRDTAVRKISQASGAVFELAKTLTPREREVMASVVRGLMNKQIAFNLGISEITVKLHRGNVMRKMEVRSVAELVRKAELMGL